MRGFTFAEPTSRQSLFVCLNHYGSYPFFQLKWSAQERLSLPIVQLLWSKFIQFSSLIQCIFASVSCCLIAGSESNFGSETPNEDSLIPIGFNSSSNSYSKTVWFYFTPIDVRFITYRYILTLILDFTTRPQVSTIKSTNSTYDLDKINWRNV